MKKATIKLLQVQPSSLFLFLLLLQLSVNVDFGYAAEIGKYFVRSPQSIVAPPGDRVTFQCETSPPPEQVRWKLNSRFLLPNDSDVRMSGSFLVVKVSKVRERYLQQVGDYQCVADFGAVSLTSLPAQLSIAELQPFSPFGRNTSIEVVEGNTVAISCDPPFSNPPPILQFWKDGEQLPEEPSGGFTIRDSTGVLILQNVTAERSQGLYWCVVTNHITGESYNSPSFTRLIVSRNMGRNGPSFVSRPKGEVVVPKEGNVTLDCIAIGNPPPIVTWRKLRNPTSVSFTSSSLHLYSVSIANEGEYVCEVYNGVGDALTSITTVVLNSPPNITNPPESQVVEEGAPLTLECGVEGLPKPRIYWVFNGNMVVGGSTPDGTLYIPQVEKRHAGLFQCFAINPMGSIYSPAEVRVMPKQFTKLLGKQQGNNVVYPPTSILKEDLGTSSSEGMGHGGGMEEEILPSYHGHLHPHHSHHKKLHPHHKRNKGRKQDMTPPSKPIVNRVSDTSVMIRWSVPPNSGYPIQFFKIQYKDVSKRGSRWNTIDDDIPPHIHSYEVQDLKQGHTYRFRIAAVYSNNDNKSGPTSDKFAMIKDPSLMQRRPNYAPVITNAVPYNNSAILLRWKMMKGAGAPSGVDGFFIYYRESTSAAEYQKVTILGGEMESAYLGYLKQGISYDIKVQAFNRAGASPFSSILAAKTMGQPSTEKPDPSETYDHDLVIPDPPPPPRNDQRLYLILGSIFVGFWIVICGTCALIYKCKQRRGAEDAKYPPVVPASALNPHHHHQDSSSDKEFIHPYHIPTITSALDEKETSFVERGFLTNNNNCRTNPAHLLNNHNQQSSVCDLSSFKSGSTNETELQLMTNTNTTNSSSRNYNIIPNSNSLHRNHHHHHRNNNAAVNTPLVSLSTNNFPSSHHSQSLRKLPYLSCSSQDDLDKGLDDDEEEDNNRGSRIFPKEHYKVSRKHRSRRNLNMTSNPNLNQNKL